MPAILYVFLSQGQRIIQRLGPAGNYIETVRGIGYKIGGEKE